MRAASLARASERRVDQLLGFWDESIGPLSCPTAQAISERPIDKFVNPSGANPRAFRRAVLG